MVATQADQRIARFQRAAHIPLDEVPRIGGRIEVDIAVIHECARGAQVDACFAPDAVRIRNQLATNERRRFRRAAQEGRVLVVRYSQQGQFDHGRLFRVGAC